MIPFQALYGQDPQLSCDGIQKGLRLMWQVFPFSNVTLIIKAYVCRPKKKITEDNLRKITTEENRGRELKGNLENSS